MGIRGVIVRPPATPPGQVAREKRDSLGTLLAPSMFFQKTPGVLTASIRIRPTRQKGGHPGHRGDGRRGKRGSPHSLDAGARCARRRESAKTPVVHG